MADGISIGGFYAFILGKNENVELSVVARSNYEEVKRDVRKLARRPAGVYKCTNK